VVVVVGFVTGFLCVTIVVVSLLVLERFCVDERDEVAADTDGSVGVVGGEED